MHDNYFVTVKADLNPEHTKAGIKVTVAGAVINLLLALVKFIAGVLGSSTALVADALHSLSDLISDGVIFVSLKIASQSADASHPYGHGRAETIGAFVLGGTLGVVGVFMAIDALIKIQNYSDLKIPDLITIWAIVGSILIKEGLYHYTVRIGRKYDMQAVIANAWHHRTDSLSSIAVLVGILAATTFDLPILDPIAALVVVYMIVKIGYDISKEAVKELMESSVSTGQLELIQKVVLDSSDVRKFHELKARHVGKDVFVDLHIIVDPFVSLTEAHNISEIVRANLKKEANVTDAIVHIDAEDDFHYKSVQLDKEKFDQELEEAIKSIDGTIKVSKTLFHILNGKALADVTLEFDHGITIGLAKERAELLIDKLSDSKVVAAVTIRCGLSLAAIEQRFAADQFN
ncbi:MAG: cation diffusion facilitator family transporter [Nitrospinota bacterium]